MAPHRTEKRGQVTEENQGTKGTTKGKKWDRGGGLQLRTHEFGGGETTKPNQGRARQEGDCSGAKHLGMTRNLLQWRTDKGKQIRRKRWAKVNFHMVSRTHQYQKRGGGLIIGTTRETHSKNNTEKRIRSRPKQPSPNEAPTRAHHRRSITRQGQHSQGVLKPGKRTKKQRGEEQRGGIVKATRRSAHLGKP